MPMVLGDINGIVKPANGVITNGGTRQPSAKSSTVLAKFIDAQRELECYK
jgi:hypothetical protein